MRSSPCKNRSALMWAAAEGHLDVVDALLDKGANANLKARSSELTTRSTRADYPSGGFTALHWAVRNGDEAVVRRLVEGGADLNITNADGATPMMLAIVNDRFDLAAKLVELGADAERRLALLRDGDARRDHGLARSRRARAACRSSERADGARSRQGAARSRRGSRQADRPASSTPRRCAAIRRPTRRRSIAQRSPRTSRR